MMRNNPLAAAGRKTAAAIAISALALLLASCAGKKEAEPIPPATAAKGAPAAEQWLEQAAGAAATMKKYAFELQMSQDLGPAGETKGSYVRVEMQGKAEREPLKLDQTIVSVIDGEESTLRTIVTPEAYFMYLPEYEEWSRLSKAVAEENAETLSDFQINPEKAIERIRGLGESLSAERSGNAVVVRYEGNGPEAKAFMAGLLKSTLGLTDSEEVIANELEVKRLKVDYHIDADRHWPLSYRIETELTVDLEPGRRTPVRQTVAGTYSKPNATQPIVVPPEALEAPDPSEIEDLLDFGT